MAAPDVTTSDRSSDGLTTRQKGRLLFRNRPMHDDSDRLSNVHDDSDHLSNVQSRDAIADGIYSTIRELEDLMQEIEAERTYNVNDCWNDLVYLYGIMISCMQMIVIKVEAILKNNMRRLTQSIALNGSDLIMHVILFPLFCCFLVNLWTKFYRH